MSAQESPREERRRARQQAGTVGGFVGFFLGFLAQLTVASETPDQFGVGQAAFFVLALMVGAYTLGWLLGPAIARMFSES